MVNKSPSNYVVIFVTTTHLVVTVWTKLIHSEGHTETTHKDTTNHYLTFSHYFLKTMRQFVIKERINLIEF